MLLKKYLQPSPVIHHLQCPFSLLPTTPLTFRWKGAHPHFQAMRSGQANQYISFSGHSDWFRNEHMTQACPIRVALSFSIHSFVSAGFKLERKSPGDWWLPCCNYCGPTNGANSKEAEPKYGKFVQFIVVHQTNSSWQWTMSKTVLNSIHEMLDSVN